MPVWEEHSYTRKDENGNLISLEEYEKTMSKKAFNYADLKLYCICGVGFMIDAYDLFIVNLASPLWAYQFFTVGNLNTTTQVPPPAIPFLLRGTVNAAANIGNVVGQLLFGFLGDAFGRKFVYGKELVLAMLGLILVISLPANSPALNTGVKKMWWLFGFRLLLGTGIGGDYPLSASIVAERSSLANRGRMLGWIFSNQGWGTVAASVVTLLLLAIFDAPLQNGGFSIINSVWRLQIGLALVPCASLLYFRFTMPEGRKFLQSKELSNVSSTIGDTVHSEDVKKVVDAEGNVVKDVRAAYIETHIQEPEKNNQWAVFVEYFSRKDHAITLFGTAMTWFLVDVAFYGINLNQSVILTDIGYSTGSTPYDYLVRNAEGNLIIAVSGYLPGYFITIALIEKMGRKNIQNLGFLVTALCFGILAGCNHSISSNVRFFLIIVTQLFMNFGPNATTFIIPGEAFPARVKALAFGISAAVGKLGAILSGIGFNYWSQTDTKKYPGAIGLSGVLWIFFACELAGAVVTWFCVPETTGIDADAIDYEECKAALQLAMSGHGKDLEEDEPAKEEPAKEVATPEAPMEDVPVKDGEP